MLQPGEVLKPARIRDLALMSPLIRTYLANLNDPMVFIRQI